jgi:hypothetical protein
LFANAPGSPVSVQGGPGNVLIGDMNNDRKLDRGLWAGSFDYRPRR